jgi:HD-GYP domain-containing protein (c-di-GMP phosphodiesterase class II)
MGNYIGLPQKQIRYLQLAGLVHDVGFFAINDRILDKRSSLTTEEYACVKCHPALGMRILDFYDFPGDIIKAVVQHHESFDGSGYPIGLKGERISLYGRILFIAEAFDTMTNDTPYRDAYPIDVAMKSIKDMSNRNFDPELVRAMLDSEELTNFYMQKDVICHNAVRSAFHADDLFTL